MSINSAMLAGVSGLISNSSSMAVISDNIANVNTTAYKRNRTDFTRLVNAQSSSTTYNAGGVTAGTRQLVSAQGNINSTTLTTDMAIQGNGFFIVSPKAQVGSMTPDIMYTRVGTFQPNNDGYLENHAGFVLRGWRLDENGAVIGSTTSPQALEEINVNAISNSAAPSTVASLTGNLKSSTTVSAAAAAVAAAGPGAYNAATNNMASGAVTPDAQWQFQVIDSLGGSKTFQVSFLKSATPNQWFVEMTSVPASNVAVGAPLVNGQVKTGTLAFTPSGLIDTAATSASLLAPLQIGAHTAGAPAANAVNWSLGTGLEAQTFTVDIGQNTNSLGSITQFDADTGLNSSSADGSSTGDLASLEIDTLGNITAIFTSGLAKKIYKIPLADFVNEDGLKAVEGGNYMVTTYSGPVTLKSAGDSGAGTVKAGALEASTVDLALEFSNMILTQRAYSASSKIITTADQMLDELIRMKQ